MSACVEDKNIHPIDWIDFYRIYVNHFCFLRSQINKDFEAAHAMRAHVLIVSY